MVASWSDGAGSGSAALTMPWGLELPIVMRSFLLCLRRFRLSLHADTFGEACGLAGWFRWRLVDDWRGRLLTAGGAADLDCLGSLRWRAGCECLGRGWFLLAFH